ncbi:tight adherence protein B [Sphingomonas vulcanisoli]|uniref:Tight adherence protein B n=1 Tax=Sphingomonas vulcanisoli TaxID=1658060 RepID=A0ABX0TT88_9SPHN|nr:type II secretion system F family protein [Sphingomonas vulcanisoli]NIJ07000.1 tight adherence protein B [Sphingomonas vulcanisoli]
MMIVAVLFVLGSGLTLGALLSGSGADKARKRRLEALRARHVEGNVETQMRRISANRQNNVTGIWALLPRRELLERRLAATGKPWTVTNYMIASGVLVVVAWAILLMRGMPLLITFSLGIVIGAGLPHWLIGRMGKRRAAKFVAKFPDAIELLVRGLRSGLPISETIGVVGREVPDPVGTEFRTVADKMKIGRTMDAALQDSADRLQTSEFQFFVISLAIQRETGGNLAETLSNLAEVLRKRMQMKLKVAAMSSESKASAYIIGSLPFIVFGLIMWINPTYMGGFFHDPRLMIAAGGGAVWMGLGVFIMAKMINFEI